LFMTVAEYTPRRGAIAPSYSSARLFSLLRRYCCDCSAVA
jgi:hypothetical protein